MKVSVIMPVYNGGTTLLETLKSLFLHKKYFDELIVINDGSKDNSKEILEKFTSKRKFQIKIVNNKTPGGLAAAYNSGIRFSKGEIIVTIHQDILLKKNSFEKLLKPLLKNDKNIVASTHTVLHPRKIWNNYNFWQKAFFSRMVEKSFTGMDGKFDAFKRSSFKKVGYFDNINFRTAGEDGDMWDKLKKIGEVADSGAKIVHIHTSDPNFGPKDIIHKQAQYSETQGVLLRRGKIRTFRDFARSFLREILLIMLLVPYIWYLAVVLILVYSFLYTKEVFLSQAKDVRVLVLPLLNIYLLFVSFVFSTRGLINGKQKI